MGIGQGYQDLRGQFDRREESYLSLFLSPFFLSSLPPFVCFENHHILSLGKENNELHNYKPVTNYFPLYQ